MIIPVPWMARRAAVINHLQDATLYVWLYRGIIHAYFDLLPDTWQFYCGVDGWHCILPDGRKIKAGRILNSDGTEFTEGFFSESREFLIEFPPSVDTDSPCMVLFTADTARGFDLYPLTEAEMTIFNPETEQRIMDVVLSHCDYMYQYFRLMTDPDTGEVKMVSWLQRSGAVPPADMLRDNPELLFDGCQGLMVRRECKPGYVIEDGHGGIKPEPE